jgi:uncharacterized protein YwgA
VEHVDEHLSVRDAVLVIVDAAGGVVEGRTAVQKLAYFASLALPEDFGHHAHYYGPYSRAVESALINKSFAGDLDESVARFQSWSGPDIRQYTYKLSEQGRVAVGELRAENPHLCAAIDKVVSGLKALVPGLSQHPLSLAAKVDYIVSHRPEEATVGEIPQLAREHGWEVSDEDVQLAADILAGISRVQEPRHSA